MNSYAVRHKRQSPLTGLFYALLGSGRNKSRPLPRSYSPVQFFSINQQSVFLSRLFESKCTPITPLPTVVMYPGP